MTASRSFRRARDRKRGVRPRRGRVRRTGGRARLPDHQGGAPVLQLGEGAGRHPGRVRRRRLAGAARRGRLEELARDAPNRRLVEILTARGARTHPLARGERRRVHARERRLPARPLRRRDAQAAPPGRRPHRPRDHAGVARGLRGLGRDAAPAPSARRARPGENGWMATCRLKSGEDVEIDGGDRHPRRWRPLLPRGRGARRALDQPPWRDRRGDPDRARARRRAPRPRRAPVPPERRRLAAEHAGLLHSRDDARLRRRPPERRPRGVHRLARPARRGFAGDLRRGRGRPRGRDRGRPARRLPRHDAHHARRTPRSPSRTCCAATVQRRHRPAPAADPHLSRAPLPERRARHRRPRRDDGRRPLRVRRDRRRHARAQPDDGQLAARVLRFRTQGRAAAAERASA